MSRLLDEIERNPKLKSAKTTVKTSKNGSVCEKTVS